MKKGKKSIEYSDVSWNPISGCRARNCAVRIRLGKCWAEKQSLRMRGRHGYDLREPFKPTFHRDKLEIPLKWKKPRRIAACYMGDIGFAYLNDLGAVLAVVRLTPRHRYYFLSKFPSNLLNVFFPQNAWVGTTINCQEDIYRMLHLRLMLCKIRFLHFEPIYDEISFDQTFMGRLSEIDWFVLGSQTNPEFQPKREWVEGLLKIADRYDIPVFMKNNLKYEPKRQEFPKE